MDSFATGASTAAVIGNLVENCRLRGFPVERYLRELLTVLPGVSVSSVIAQLTPAQVAESRRRQG